MAGIPLKSGADFYNLEASRMRLHNLGADPTEVGTGLIYFNTSTGMNTSGRARIYTGNGFKSLAFLEDVDGRIKTIEDMLNVDTAEGVVSTWNEIQAFLDSVQEGTDLMDMLNGKLDKKGGTLEGPTGTYTPLVVKTTDPESWIGFTDNVGTYYIGIHRGVPSVYKSGVGTHTLIHSGNYSNYALPLSGGTIEGGTDASPLFINTTANTSRIGFKKNSTTVGYLGFSDTNTPVFVNVNGGASNLLHSGNIGEYKSGDSDKLGGLEASGYARNLRNLQADLADIDIALNGLYGGKVRDAAGTFPTTTDGYKNGAFLSFGWDGFGVQMSSRRNKTWLRTLESNAFSEWRELAFTDQVLLLDGSNKMAGRLYMNTYAIQWDMNNTFQLLTPYNANNYKLSYYDGSSWKTIAFTDSNVASAQALITADNAKYAYHNGNNLLFGRSGIATNIYGSEIKLRPNGTIAFLINSSGNVTIGSSDLAGTSCKLHVSGRIKAESTIFNNSWVTDGARAGFVSNKGGTYCFGFGASATNGSNASFGLCKDSAGEWQQELMTFVESSGNVGIGTTNPTEKLHVVGNLHVTGNIIADGEVSAGGAAEESGEGGGGTGGGVEPYVFTFTPSTTTVSVNHNISSEDVIVQVYEKDATSGKWSVVLVDIEIVDSTRVDLHFGRTETTEHKVVIIG